MTFSKGANFGKAVIVLTGLLALFLTLSACGDDSVSDDPTEDNLANATGAIQVVLESNDQPMTTVSMAPMDRHVTICYDDGECDERAAGGSGVGGAGNTITLKESDPDRTVVGVSADLLSPEDEEGTGTIFVAEDGGAEFFRTDEFVPGDVVEFEIGEVE